MQITRYPLLILILCTLAVWGLTISFGFVWDDFPMIAMNESLHHWDTLWKGWTHDFWMLHDSPQISGYWRPMATMVHLLLTKLMGGAPWVFHLVNVFLHMMVAYFFYQFLVELKWVKWVWISVLFFLIHPLASETVSFNSAIPDLLCAFFGWWAVVFWMKSTSIKNKLACTLVLLGLSFLSKESGVFFGIFILGIEWILLREHSPSSRKKLSFSVLGLMIIYTVLHLQVTSGIGSRAIWGGSLMIHFATVVKLFLYEMFLVFVPIGSSPTRDFELGAWNQWEVWLGLTLLIGMIGSFFYFFKKNKVLAFGIFFYLVFWFPVSNIIPAEGLIANRYMYIPSMAGAALVGFIFNNFEQFPKFMIAVLGIWGACASSASLAWKSSDALWRHAVEASPKSSVAWNEYGNVLASQKKYEQALDAYTQAIQLRPEYQEASFNRALIFFRRKDIGAKEIIQKHLRIFPNDPQAWDLLGSVFESENNIVSALEVSKKAVDLAPHQWKFRYNLASVYLKMRDYDDAILELERAVQFVPDQYEVQKNLAGAYCLNANYHQCMDRYGKLLKKFPDQANELVPAIEQVKQLLKLTEGS